MHSKTMRNQVPMPRKSNNSRVSASRSNHLVAAMTEPAVVEESFPPLNDSNEQSTLLKVQAFSGAPSNSNVCIGSFSRQNPKSNARGVMESTAQQSDVQVVQSANFEMGHMSPNMAMYSELLMSNIEIRTDQNNYGPLVALNHNVDIESPPAPEPITLVATGSELKFSTNPQDRIVKPIEPTHVPIPSFVVFDNPYNMPSRQQQMVSTSTKNHTHRSNVLGAKSRLIQSASQAERVRRLKAAGSRAAINDMQGLSMTGSASISKFKNRLASGKPKTASGQRSDIDRSLRELQEFFGKPATFTANSRTASGIIRPSGARATSSKRLMKTSSNPGMNAVPSTHYMSLPSSKATISTQVRFFKKQQRPRQSAAGKIFKSCLSLNAKQQSEMNVQNTFDMNTKGVPNTKSLGGSSSALGFAIQSSGKVHTGPFNDKQTLKLDFIDLLQMFALSSREPLLVPLRLHPTYLLKVRQLKDQSKAAQNFDVRFTHYLETSGKPCPLLTRGQYQVRSLDLSHLDLKQVLQETVARLSTSRLQSRVGSEALGDNSANFDLNLPLGTILASAQGASFNQLQRQTLYMRDYMSVESFTKAIVKVVGRANITGGPCIVALQLESHERGSTSSVEGRQNGHETPVSSQMFTQPGRPIVGSQVVLQDYEYRGQHEGQGRVDKLWTSIIDKMVFQKLVRDRRMSHLREYMIPVQTQRQANLLSPQGNLTQFEFTGSVNDQAGLPGPLSDVDDTAKVILPEDIKQLVEHENISYNSHTRSTQPQVKSEMPLHLNIEKESLEATMRNSLVKQEESYLNKTDGVASSDYVEGLLQTAGITNKDLTDPIFATGTDEAGATRDKRVDEVVRAGLADLQEHLGDDSQSVPLGEASQIEQCELVGPKVPVAADDEPPHVEPIDLQLMTGRVINTLKSQLSAWLRKQGLFKIEDGNQLVQPTVQLKACKLLYELAPIRHVHNNNDPQSMDATYRTMISLPSVKAAKNTNNQQQQLEVKLLSIEDFCMVITDEKQTNFKKKLAKEYLNCLFDSSDCHSRPKLHLEVEDGRTITLNEDEKQLVNVESQQIEQSDRHRMVSRQFAQASGNMTSGRLITESEDAVLPQRLDHSQEKPYQNTDLIDEVNSLAGAAPLKLNQSSSEDLQAAVGRLQSKAASVGAYGDISAPATPDEREIRHRQELQAQKTFYEGLMHIAQNYGHDEPYRKDIVANPSRVIKGEGTLDRASKRIPFVERQQRHQAVKKSLLLQRHRLTQKTAPNSVRFLKNYPLYMEKQGSHLHSKFLFGTKQEEMYVKKGYDTDGRICVRPSTYGMGRGPDSGHSVTHLHEEGKHSIAIGGLGSGKLLSQYKRLFKERERAEKYFQFEKREGEVKGPAFMASKNYDQDVAQAGGELVFGGLMLADTKNITNVEEGTIIATELGYSKRRLIEDQMDRDSVHHARSTRYVIPKTPKSSRPESNLRAPHQKFDCLPADDLSSHYASAKHRSEIQANEDEAIPNTILLNLSKNYKNMMIDESLGLVNAVRDLQPGRELSILDQERVNQIKASARAKSSGSKKKLLQDKIRDNAVLQYGTQQSGYKFNEQVRAQLRYLHDQKTMNQQFRVKAASRPMTASTSYGIEARQVELVRPLNEDLFGDIPPNLILAHPGNFVDLERHQQQLEREYLDMETQELTAQISKQKHHLNLNLAMANENGGVKLYIARNQGQIELMTAGTKENETVNFDQSAMKSRSPALGHSQKREDFFKKEQNAAGMDSSLSNESKSRRAEGSSNQRMQVLGRQMSVLSKRNTLNSSDRGQQGRPMGSFYQKQATFIDKREPVRLLRQTEETGGARSSHSADKSRSGLIEDSTFSAIWLRQFVQLMSSHVCLTKQETPAQPMLVFSAGEPPKKMLSIKDGAIDVEASGCTRLLRFSAKAYQQFVQMQQIALKPLDGPAASIESNKQGICGYSSSLQSRNSANQLVKFSRNKSQARTAENLSLHTTSPIRKVIGDLNYRDVLQTEAFQFSNLLYHDVRKTPEMSKELGIRTPSQRSLKQMNKTGSSVQTSARKVVLSNRHQDSQNLGDRSRDRARLAQSPAASVNNPHVNVVNEDLPKEQEDDYNEEDLKKVPLANDVSKDNALQTHESLGPMPPIGEAELAKMHDESVKDQSSVEMDRNAFFQSQQSLTMFDNLPRSRVQAGTGVLNQSGVSGVYESGNENQVQAADQSGSADANEKLDLEQPLAPILDVQMEKSASRASDEEADALGSLNRAKFQLTGTKGGGDTSGGGFSTLGVGSDQKKAALAPLQLDIDSDAGRNLVATPPVYSAIGEPKKSVQSSLMLLEEAARAQANAFGLVKNPGVAFVDIMQGTMQEDDRRQKTAEMLKAATVAAEKVNQLIKSQLVSDADAGDVKDEDLMPIFEAWKQRQIDWVRACIAHTFTLRCPNCRSINKSSVSGKSK